MKPIKRIICLVLLAATIALMFLPVARFNENLAGSLDEDIAKYEERLQKAKDKQDQKNIDKWQGKLDEALAEKEAALAESAAGVSYALMPGRVYANKDEASGEVTYQITQDITIDRKIVNQSQGYEPNLPGFRNCVWAAAIVLALALVFMVLGGNKYKSPFFTLSGICNLAAIILLGYLLLRISAFPIAAPYGNAQINTLVALLLVAMPLVALVLNILTLFDTKRTMIYILCIFLCALSLLPFWIMIVNATRSSQQIQQGVSLIPSHYFGYNWNVLQGKNFNLMTGFANSAFISVFSTLLSVFFSALTAYGLVVYNFKGRKLATAIVMAIIMIPTQVTGTGFFIFMYQLGWTNNFLPLIIPGIAAASTVYFFRQYLKANFQVALVEAARIDGAGEFYAFFKIIMPIMVPAMATMGIMAVIASWNNYLTPLMLLTNPNLKTLPMMVKELRGDIYKTEFGSIYLGLTMTALPLIVVYFALSKYIIAGIAVGGVKE